MTKNQIPTKLTQDAVDAIRNDWCPDFFKNRLSSPKRLFCDYFNDQIDDLLKSYHFKENESAQKMTYQEMTVDISLIRLDEGLTKQDRRDLDNVLLRRNTMLSFQKNGDEINAGAAVLRQLDDGTYAVGDARHRLLWSLALGCEKANAYVVNCPDDHVWDALREEFNDMNGAERSEEERLFLVHRKVQQGGHGSRRELCRKHGVSDRKYAGFREQQEIISLAQEKGLQVASTTPPNIVQVAVQAVEKGVNPEMAQKLVDAVPATAKIPKVNVENVTKDLEEKGYTEEAVTTAVGNLRELASINKVKTGGAKGSRGPNKPHSEKITQSIDAALRATKHGTVQEIGMPTQIIPNYIQKLEQILAYLQAGLNITINPDKPEGLAATA